LISACVNKGEKFPHSQSQGENTQGGVCLTKFHLNVECMYSCERLHLFRGSCTWFAFAGCVEPLPLLEGLAVFWLFELY
jgi:hypothetical protein